MKNNSNECSGLIFKAHTSIFWSEKKASIDAKFQLRLMKRMSCRCEACDSTFKALGQGYLFDSVYIREMLPLELMESPNTYLIAKATWDNDPDEGGIEEIEFKVITWTPKNIIRGRKNVRS